MSGTAETVRTPRSRARAAGAAIASAARRHPVLFAFAVLFAITLVTRLGVVRKPLLFDAPIYLYLGDTILQGETPYADAADDKGPVLYLLFAVIRLLADDSATAVRLTVVPFAAITALALGAYVARFAGRGAGIAAGVLMAALAPIIQLEGFDPNTDPYGLAFLVGAWYLATRGTVLSSVAAGAALSAGVLVNVAFAWTLPLVAFELWRATGPPGRVTRLAAALGGGLLVAIPIFAWLGLAGALDDMYDQIVGWVGEAAGPKHGIRELLDIPVGELWLAGLLGCAIASFDARLRRAAIPAALWILGAWARVKVTSYAWPHHYYPALPGIVAGIALGMAAVWPPQPLRRVGLALLVAGPMVWIGIVSPQWDLVQTSGWPNVSATESRAYDVAAVIERRTAPGEKIFVPGGLPYDLPDGTPSPGRGSPAVYWLTDRRSPTRYFISFLERSPEQQAERLRDLMRDPPAAIAVMPEIEIDADLQRVIRRYGYRTVYDVDGARVLVRSGRG